MLQTQLPKRDTSTPDAYILIGSNRSQGLELRAKTRLRGFSWSANATYLNARVENVVNAIQGHYLVGIPKAYGAISVSSPVFNGGSVWSTWQASSYRPANDINSIQAPGYAVWNLGFKHPMVHEKGEWSFSVDNVLDRRYVRGLTGLDNVWQGSRRVVRASLTWHL